MWLAFKEKYIPEFHGKSTLLTNSCPLPFSDTNATPDFRLIPKVRMELVRFWVTSICSADPHVADVESHVPKSSNASSGFREMDPRTKLSAPSSIAILTYDDASCPLVVMLTEQITVSPCFGFQTGNADNCSTAETQDPFPTVSSEGTGLVVISTIGNAASITFPGVAILIPEFAEPLAAEMLNRVHEDVSVTFVYPPAGL